jgi:hypothetical protein
MSNKQKKYLGILLMLIALGLCSCYFIFDRFQLRWDTPVFSGDLKENYVAQDSAVP